jgi:hypothetical protein
MSDHVPPDRESTDGGSTADEPTHPALASVDPVRDGDGLDEQALEVLLVDYRVAAEDARYRDRFLHYTYYLAVVALGLVLSAAESVFALATARLWVLAPVGFVGAFIFGTLLVWSESFREARNSSWARQDEIETYLDSIRPGLLRSNAATANRLTFGYEYRNERNAYARREVARYVRYFLLGATVFLAAVMLVGLVDGLRTLA